MRVPIMIPDELGFSNMRYIPKAAPPYFGNQDSDPKYKAARASKITNIRSSEWARKGYEIVRGENIKEGDKLLYVEEDRGFFPVEVVRMDYLPPIEEYLKHYFKNTLPKEYLNHFKYPLSVKLIFILRREDGKDIFPAYNYTRGSEWFFYKKISPDISSNTSNDL